MGSRGPKESMKAERSKITGFRVSVIKVVTEDQSTVVSPMLLSNAWSPNMVSEGARKCWPSWLKGWLVNCASDVAAIAPKDGPLVSPYAEVGSEEGCSKSRFRGERAPVDEVWTCCPWALTMAQELRLPLAGLKEKPAALEDELPGTPLIMFQRFSSASSLVESAWCDS